MLCCHNICLVPEHSHHPKEELSVHLAVSSLPASGNHSSAFCLQIDLFWVFHMNEITQYVTFCVWLLSRGIMFSRFIWITVSLPYSVVWVSQSSSAGGLFACFYLVVIVDAIDTRVLVFLCPDVFRILFLIPLGMQRL